MKAHVRYKQLTPLLLKRALQNYIEEIDPGKTYFIETEIHQWLEPSEELLSKILIDFNKSRFKVFEDIHLLMVQAIQRRNMIEGELREEKHLTEAPPLGDVSSKDFRKLSWAKDVQELQDRLFKIKSLQVEAASKLNEEMKNKALLRIEKKRSKFEEEFLNEDPIYREQFILTNILKATAASLDTHTAYFTPDEANRFMIGVQQRLFGIGAQLRDDLNGLTIVKIVEGGPASKSKELKVKDRIIAVNGEPIVGLDILDAVDLIQGEEGTPVILTVIREKVTDKHVNEEKLDIKLIRGEVVIKQNRIESSFEPFGDGGIACIRLFSFYQDPESSSAKDLEDELKRLLKEHNVKGVILDLRYNGGGLLPQAVAVAGLFITKGIVVSIKDDKGNIQHLRDTDGTTVWDGPLMILVNRASASAAEIVAQSLQDYGRAIIIGDDHTYGKGTFQTFTLNANNKGMINPQGEYKVTKGMYFTVSGKSPQVFGVGSHVVVPGMLSEIEIGEKYEKFHLENEKIKGNYEDNLSDIPFYQRSNIAKLYRFNLQPRLTHFVELVPLLSKNSNARIEKDVNYQNFLNEIKSLDSDKKEKEMLQFGQNDLQLQETYNVMKDFIFLLKNQKDSLQATK